MHPEHRGTRRVYRSALPVGLCQELLFIQRSLAVIGYRPSVQSLTLYELLRVCPQMLPVVARARQLIWDAVEEQFGLPCEVWPETTSLISWTAGASIGWHHDANRPYLAARHFSAVAYLNTQGVDFQGGTFCFQSGDPPVRVQPAAGTLLVYTADESNVHSVEEVTAGERSTFTMWFTLDAEHQEDTKVLSKLQECACCGLPPTMYLQDNGLDVRVARLQHRLGLTVTALPAALQHTQSGPAQPAPQVVAAQTGQAQALSELDTAQERYKVQCCSHPGPHRKCSTEHGQPAEVHFDSLQQAVMAATMLEWMVGTPSCEAVVAVEGSRAALCDNSYRPCDAPDTRGSGCRSCALLTQLPSAAQRLQQYLQQAAQSFDVVLPTWHQLGSLVPPAGHT